ncbi:hypothetical protein AB0H77_04070 [Streptomyces sp. NPDC050844]|uniref:hypothetical protein n=1 Tax=Streptomyces sp. NPDC050844 TaxID=3155790 RepID=UPI0033C2B66B
MRSAAGFGSVSPMYAAPDDRSVKRERVTDESLVPDSRMTPAEQGPGWALTRTESGLTSAVVALHGWDEEAGIAREVAANAFGPHSATPYLTRAGHAGGASVHVTLVALSRDTVLPTALRESISCAVDGDCVRVRFPDGAVLEV